ncbi:M20 family metallopeptidase [Streptomyces sp. NPDC088746]|uniref:M20 metallopeptidase family protein n=1 Tax=Streptomyces sp. NPDC088746 TaxID=3365885 RepID=UPI003800F995
MTTYRQQAESMAAELVELRHSLHREPETGLQLPRTQAKVLEALSGLPLDITTGKQLSSVTAVLRGGRPGPAVLLRGDMDALPVQELTDVPYVSQVEGAMHACGHDQHTAMLVGAARLLSARRSELPGTVVFMFQPGEEGHNGAGLMIDEGVLEAAGQPLVGAYSVHVASNGVPLGMMGGRAGTATASSAELHVTVRGRGGHGSNPHQAADPLPVAAEMVTALQTLVTRTANAFDPVVITVGTFHAGTKVNVIPADATFGATVRATSEKGMTAFLGRAEALCGGIATAHGLTADVRSEVQYPALVCAPEAVDLGEEAAHALYGPDSFLRIPTANMASEDFARVAAEVPAAQYMVGARPPNAAPDAAFNHSPYAVFDDGAIPVGTALLAEVAERRLRQG